MSAPRPEGAGSRKAGRHPLRGAEGTGTPSGSAARPPRAPGGGRRGHVARPFPGTAEAEVGAPEKRGRARRHRRHQHPVLTPAAPSAASSARPAEVRAAGRTAGCARGVVGSGRRAGREGAAGRCGEGGEDSGGEGRCRGARRGDRAARHPAVGCWSTLPAGLLEGEEAQRPARLGSALRAAAWARLRSLAGVPCGRALWFPLLGKAPCKQLSVGCD